MATYLNNDNTELWRLQCLYPLFLVSSILDHSRSQVLPALMLIEKFFRIAHSNTLDGKFYTHMGSVLYYMWHRTLIIKTGDRQYSQSPSLELWRRGN